MSRMLWLGVLWLAACSSSSTNEGSGGTGGGSGSIAERCDATCNTLVAAGCADSVTKEGCMLTCKAMTSAPECDSTGLAYFDCAKGKTATCAGSVPEVSACAAEYSAAADCAASQSPNPAIESACATYCDNIAAKSCAKAAPKNECNTNCRWAGATGIGCDSEWATFLGCANSHAITCLAEYPVSLACGAEFKVYNKCVNAAGSN